MRNANAIYRCWDEFLISRRNVGFLYKIRISSICESWIGIIWWLIQYKLLAVTGWNLNADSNKPLELQTWNDGSCCLLCFEHLPWKDFTYVLLITLWWLSKGCIKVRLMLKNIKKSREWSRMQSLAKEFCEVFNLKLWLIE